MEWAYDDDNLRGGFYMAEDVQEIRSLFTWTFSDERPIPKEVEEYLIPQETPVAAFYTVRDYAVFTDKRIIVVDSQGLTGKKKEVYTLPYRSILFYSVENAGTLLDWNSEIELVTKAGHIKIKLGRKVDVKALQILLAKAIL